MNDYKPDEVVYARQDDGSVVIRSIAADWDNEAPDGYVLVVNRQAAFLFGEVVSVDRVWRAHDD